MPSSHFMFHYGQVGVCGNAKDVYSSVAFTQKQDEDMIDIYVDAIRDSNKFKGQSDSQIRKHIINTMDKKGDVFLTAKEAVEWGFADGVVEKWPSHAKWPKEK